MWISSVSGAFRLLRTVDKCVHRGVVNLDFSDIDEAKLFQTWLKTTLLGLFILKKEGGNVEFEAVLRFWFEEVTPRQWFQKDLKFDQMLAQRFSELHRQAVACELYQWREEPRGRLAEVIVLDQFSRNIHRDSAEAFAHDSLALALAQEAVARGDDQPLRPIERSFLYMPYMHSESAKIHEWAEALFRANGLEDNLKFELKHKEIIDRFGRYPHRNELLGRESTEEELAFLKQPGSGF